jgi:hypothetical protein
MILRPFLEKYGKFNAGAFVIRNSDSGINFLSKWRSLCIEWCEDRISEKKYSNQGYLTHLADQFKESVSILANSGGNVAPWNSNFVNTRKKGTSLTYKNEKISFFHFHGISESKNTWSINHLRYGNIVSRRVLKSLYAPYLASLISSSQIFKIELKKSNRFQASFLSFGFDLVLWATSLVLVQRVPKRWIFIGSRVGNYQDSQ